MKQQPRGLLVPIATPFDPETGDVAAVAFRNNARALLERGVDGLVVAGSTGEGPLLSEDEYRSALGWLRDVVPAGRFLIAGAGRESARATVEACRTASEEGADAALIRPPSYYASTLSQSALVDHFRSIADGSPLPILLYNIPKYTHVALSEALISALSEHPNVVGAKDSSGDLKNLAAYQAAAPDWSLFVGSGSHYYAGLELGAVGGILAVGCFATVLVCQIGEAFAVGDRVVAGSKQEAVSPLNREIIGKLGVPGVKAAMDAVGLYGGPVRLPLRALDPGARGRITSMLRDAGVAISEDSGSS